MPRLWSNSWLSSAVAGILRYHTDDHEMEITELLDALKRRDWYQYHNLSIAELLETLMIAMAGDHYRYGVERVEPQGTDGAKIMITLLPEAEARHAKLRATEPRPRKRYRS